MILNSIPIQKMFIFLKIAFEISLGFEICLDFEIAI
jgi:hypothetical protein